MGVRSFFCCTIPMLSPDVDSLLPESSSSVGEQWSNQVLRHLPQLLNLAAETPP